MSLKDVVQQLEIYGEQKEEKDYFINLGKTLAKSYYHSFSNKKMAELYKSFTFYESTQLKLNAYFENKKDIAYLAYQETQRLTLKEGTFITFDLSGTVLELIVDYQKLNTINLTLHGALEILRHRNIEIDDNKIEEYFKKLKSTSLIYNLAFLILQKNIKSKMDVVRAGMFKNAYYKIICLELPKLAQKEQKSTIPTSRARLKA